MGAPILRSIRRLPTIDLEKLETVVSDWIDAELGAISPGQFLARFEQRENRALRLTQTVLCALSPWHICKLELPIFSVALAPR